MSGLADGAAHKDGCVILVFSGCATMIGFLLGFAAAVVLAAWSGW